MLANESSPQIGDPAFSLLFDNHPIPMWIYDLKTLGFLAVNNAAVVRYGYSRDEFFSMTIRDIRPTEDIPRLEQHVARERPQWQQSGQWRHRIKGGQIIDVEIVSHTLEYMGRACALVTAQDISARKQAEAEAQSYTRLYATLSQVNQAIVRIKERDALFTRICEVAVEFGSFPLAWIAQVDGETGRVLPTAIAGKQARYLERFSGAVRTLENMTGPTAIALREGRLALSQDIANDPGMSAAREAALAHGFRSSASIPLRQQGIVVGALNLYAAEPGFFTELEQALLDEIGEDISFALDAMLAEAEMRVARELFSRLFHLSPVPTVLLRYSDRQYTDVNQAFERLVGRKREEMLGHTSDHIIVWVDLEKRREMLELLAATGSVQEMEFDFRTASGEIRTGLLYADVVTHEGEAYILSNVLDITERKETQARLEYQAQLLANVSDAVLASGADLTITSWNRAAEEIYGWTAEEAIGRKGQDLLRSEFAAITREEAIRTLLATGRLDSDMIQYRKDGRQIYVESRSIALYDEQGNITGFVGVNRDITERKRAEESLRNYAHTVRLQATALEFAANAILITDPNGTIEWTNPAFTALTGYTAKEAIGKNPRDLLRSGQHDRQFYQALWETVLAGKVWRGEIVNRRKDGTLYTEEQTITPVRDEEGKITHFVAIKQDITLEREARAQIQRQERLAAVGQLAAGIAHDFNNIMAVIVLYSQMTARSPLLSERERERLATIHEQAQHGAHMIRQILDFSRRAVVERRPLDLLPLLKENVKLLQRTLPEHIEVSLSTAAREPDTVMSANVGRNTTSGEFTVRADPTRIQQTLMNLAVNARDAMPTGGTLRIHLEKIRVAEGNAPMPTMEAGLWIRLNVTDTGAGIPDDILDHIFEPFFTTKSPGEGTGLGLAQVHGIVGEHDGHISVTSRPGEGTTFTIYLPALSAVDTEQPSLHIAALPRGNGETILVVEDNKEVRSALVEMLQQLGYYTQEAADGEVAIQFLRTAYQGIAYQGAGHGQGDRAARAVHLILTDVVMPRMGGVELVRALRDRGYEMPVILITGHPLDSDIDALHDLGVNAWIAKPPSPQQLALAVADALGRKNLPGSL